MNILIHNGTLLTMNDQSAVHSPGWLWLEQDRIAKMGPGPAPQPFFSRAERVIDASHMAVLPGMVNAHTHLSQSFMRGLGDDKPLLQWLKQVMWPMQSAFSAEDMRLASLLGLAENVRCGATAVNQHHKLPAPQMSDAALAAAESIGLRFQLARSWVDLGSSAEDPEHILGEMDRLYQQWHGSSNDRLRISFGPMAPWRTSDSSMRRFVRQARNWGVPTHIHVAEAQDEIDMLRQRTGRRHIEWLADLDALGPDMQLVHCVHVSDHEQELIAQSGSRVVYCPTSNMYLASGIAPISQMLDKGIAVALGTDGSASHNSQDILETVKTGVLLARVSSGNPTAIAPMQALAMLTGRGAMIMGRDDIGQLAPGFKSDLTLVNLNKLHVMPVHSPQSALVFNCNGSDVHTVIVDGQILLDDGRLTMLDEETLLEQCRRAAYDLTARAGIKEG